MYSSPAEFYAANPDLAARKNALFVAREWAGVGMLTMRDRLRAALGRPRYSLESVRRHESSDRDPRQMPHDELEAWATVCGLTVRQVIGIDSLDGRSEHGT